MSNPNGWKLHDDGYALDNTGLASEDAHLGDDKFPWRPYHCEHIKKAHGFAMEFGLYPKSSDGRTAQCPDAVRLAKLPYFRLKPQFDKFVLTSDCGSDVLAGARKEEHWDWNRWACHCLNIAVQAALKESMIEGYLAPLTALIQRFSKSRSAWNRFKRTQLQR